MPLVTGVAGPVDQGPAVSSSGSKATFTIVWPSRQILAIPASASAITIKASQGQAMIDEVTVQRPATSSTSTATLPSAVGKYLPVGVVLFEAIA